MKDVNIVKAFRQRLVRAGFTNISIYNDFNCKYSVSCTSPYGERICKLMSLTQMLATPRVVWFD